LWADALSRTIGAEVSFLHFWVTFARFLKNSNEEKNQNSPRGKKDTAGYFNRAAVAQCAGSFLLPKHHGLLHHLPEYRWLSFSPLHLSSAFHIATFSAAMTTLWPRPMGAWW
jgi:hypothetical protein